MSCCAPCRKNSSMKFILLFIFSSSFYGNGHILNIDRAYFGGTNLKEVERNLLRLNLTLKTAFKIANGIDFSAISYLQSPLNMGFQNILNPRWFVDAQLNFNINKHLDFNIRYNQNLDYFRPLPIDVFFYSLLIGGKIRF